MHFARPRWLGVADEGKSASRSGLELATVTDIRSRTAMNYAYPNSVAEVVDPRKRFKPAALRAVRAFARSRPFFGSVAERQEKFRVLNAALANAYGVAEPKLVFGTDQSRDSGSSCYIPRLNTIILRGRLSVVTFLHEWGHRLHGRSEYKACRWSLNLFRRCFPKSWSRLRFDGHMVRAVDRQ